MLAKTEGENNISELNVGCNKFGSKAGFFIGQALIENSTYKISKINFQDIVLEEEGLQRIMEASAVNKNIKVLHVGIVTDAGLQIMADQLQFNDSLIKLEFQES